MESVIGTGSVICFLYHPYLVSFSFYAIPICPLSQNSQDFSFTCLLSFLCLSWEINTLAWGSILIKLPEAICCRVVVMETMWYTCTISFISMHPILSKLWKWRSKLAWGYLVVMETMRYTFILSFIYIKATLSKLWEWRSKLYENCPRLFFVVWLSWKRCGVHVLRVSFPYVVYWGSYESEEVN